MTPRIIAAAERAARLTFGLGDLAYYMFRPGVYLIDAVWDTDMRHCERCKRRRKLWNSWFSMPRWAWLLAIALTLTSLLAVFACGK